MRISNLLIILKFSSTYTCIFFKSGLLFLSLISTKTCYQVYCEILFNIFASHRVKAHPRVRQSVVSRENKAIS